MLLTYAQTAARLNVSRMTLWRMIKRSEIRPAIVLNIGKQSRPYFHAHEVASLAMQRDPQQALELHTTTNVTQ